MIEMIDNAWDINPLEQTGDDEARGIKPCDYPNCEGCEKYILNQDGAFCTVPIVVSKQMYHLMTAELKLVREQIGGIEEVLTAMLVAPTEAESVSYGLPDDEEGLNE